VTSSDSHSGLRWIGTGLTHVGKVRSSNQDAFVVENAHRIWVVADGMGGYAGGEIASQLAVASISEYFHSHASRCEEGKEHELLLREAIQSAHRALREKAKDRPELRWMGTTVVAMTLSEGPPAVATIAHIGDSRAYVLRGRTLTQCTKDHSLMQDYMSRGLLSEQETLAHPQRHVLTRALGGDWRSEPDIAAHSLQPDDQILLCSDGVTTMLADWEILDVLLQERASAESACRALVTAVNRRGGKDNVTVLIVRQEENS
jgi:protein phosphatase